MILKGADVVIANMTLRVNAAAGKLDKIAWNAGRLIERKAKENITGKHGHEKHIITGNLRNSIDAKKPMRMSKYFYIVPIGSDVFYARYVEHRDKTGGYLHPALEETKEQVIDYIKRELRMELGLL